MSESNSQEEICTPSGVCVSDLFNNSFCFEVPIYQRVFTWGEEQFERLFKDLEEHFCSTTAVDCLVECYYLGIITVVRSEKDDHKYVLVDGQQRLTCILLLGALLGWNLDYRKLTYAARPADKKALEDVYNRIQFPQVYKDEEDKEFRSQIAMVKEQVATIGNTTMRAFLDFALAQGKGYALLQKLKKHSEIIKSKLTLLISCLPDDPYRLDIIEQNRYFEKMNYGGKQLEPHEILKVRICKGLDETYLKSWNAISYFGKFYAGCEEREASSSNPNHSCFSALTLSAYLKDDDPGEDDVRYAIYKQCKEQKKQYELDSEDRDDLRNGLISFPMFLLHVMYLYRKKNGRKDLRIGDEKCLLESFLEVEEWAIPQKKQFIDLMREYRQFLDSEIIHINSMDREFRFFFYEPHHASQRNEIRDSVPPAQQNIMEFQSMLYVSSGSDQSWLISAFEKGFHRNAEEGLETLKSIMRKHLLDAQTISVIRQAQNQWPSDCLKYGTDNRRWLALLDYLLWEEYCKIENDSHSDSIFAELITTPKFKDYKEQIRSAVRNYCFRKNRSVEHLHAQTDSDATNPEAWQDHKDYFGNLALISAGKNSEYGNQPVGGKTDRVVKLLLDGGTQGSKIESIKLLLMLAKCNGEDSKWTVEKARQHANDMLKLLKTFFIPTTTSETNDRLAWNHFDLTNDVDALGNFIEQHFFESKLPNGYSVVVRTGSDAESPKEWCGRYFDICCDGDVFKAWVGWLYGVGTYKDSPRFVIQVERKKFAELPGSSASEWYPDTLWKVWMNKDIAYSLGNMDAVANKFKKEIEVLCSHM